MAAKITLKAFLKFLTQHAEGHTDDAGVFHPAKPGLKNFLNTHDLVGTIRGVPHWRRNVNYYNRGRKYNVIRG